LWHSNKTRDGCGFLLLEDVLSFVTLPVRDDNGVASVVAVVAKTVRGCFGDLKLSFSASSNARGVLTLFDKTDVPASFQPDDEEFSLLLSFSELGFQKVLARMLGDDMVLHWCDIKSFAFYFDGSLA